MVQLAAQAPQEVGLLDLHGVTGGVCVAPCAESPALLDMGLHLRL